MTKFTPLPAAFKLPHSRGTLLIQRQSDGQPTFERISEHAAKRAIVTRAEAIKWATRHDGGMSGALRSVLFPPPLTIHHLMRERFEAAMAWAEDGAFLTAADKLEQMAADYRARHEGMLRGIEIRKAKQA